MCGQHGMEFWTLFDLIFQSEKNKTLVYGHIKLYTCSRGLIISRNDESEEYILRNFKNATFYVVCFLYWVDLMFVI